MPDHKSALTGAQKPLFYPTSNIPSEHASGQVPTVDWLRGAMLGARAVHPAIMAMARFLHDRGDVSEDVVLFCALQMADLQAESDVSEPELFLLDQIGLLKELDPEYGTNEYAQLIGAEALHTSLCNSHAQEALIVQGETGIAILFGWLPDSARERQAAGRLELFGEEGEPWL